MIKKFVVLLALLILISIISYLNNNDIMAELDISEEEFKESSETIEYKELLRNTERYIGEKITFKAKIAQILEDKKSLDMVFLKIEESEWDFENLMKVNYIMNDSKTRLLERDIVNVWGVVEGRKTYKTIMGSTETVPEINAYFIEIIE